MTIIVGYIVVLVATLGGFMVAGGNPMLLLHVSEFIVIGGIATGVLIIASPTSVIKGVIHDIQHALGGDTPAEHFMDLMKLLYELFTLGRRNGLIALDEHVGDPPASSILSKYPSFIEDQERVEFLCNALRPIIDGKIKPEQLQDILEDEIYVKEVEGHSNTDIITLIGDSLPGIGIVAAVLGIINTMSAISEGPEAVGAKVSAALTGTFLGILAAYGFINPLNKKIGFMHKQHSLYFSTMSTAITGFAKGLAPLMAIEVARRYLDSSIKPTADELEETLKSIGH